MTNLEKKIEQELLKRFHESDDSIIKITMKKSRDVLYIERRTDETGTFFDIAIEPKVNDLSEDDKNLCLITMEDLTEIIMDYDSIIEDIRTNAKSKQFLQGDQSTR